MSAELLGTISNTLSNKRGNKKERFGGMSVMFSGDFGQLTPVSGHALHAVGDETAVDVAVPSTALIGHQMWSNELTGCVMLSENYRAKNDPAFTCFLRRLRRRCVTVEDVGRLETRRIRPSLCPTVDGAGHDYGCRRGQDLSVLTLFRNFGQGTGGTVRFQHLTRFQNR